MAGRGSWSHQGDTSASATDPDSGAAEISSAWGGDGGWGGGEGGGGGGQDVVFLSETKLLNLHTM